MRTQVQIPSTHIKSEGWGGALVADAYNPRDGDTETGGSMKVNGQSIPGPSPTINNAFTYANNAEYALGCCTEELDCS